MRGISIILSRRGPFSIPFNSIRSIRLSAISSGQHLKFSLCLSLPAEVAIVKHLFAIRINRPVIPLSRIVVGAGDFFETIVERKIVPDWILPTRFAFLVEREVLCDELVNSTECQFLLSRALEGHGYECRVGVWRAHQPKNTQGKPRYI